MASVLRFSGFSKASAALLGALLLLAGAKRDLDVGIPPGSALDWGQSFPGESPPRISHLASSLNRSRERARGYEQSRSLGATPDARRFKAADSTPILSILTWDIPQHLQWIDNTLNRAPGPSSAIRSRLRPAPPRYGESMYWTTLAPLFRILLHPRQLSRAEISAHLLELGDACLPALRAASNEAEIRLFCIEMVGRLESVAPAKIDCEVLPATLRNGMLRRFASIELLRHEPYDVTAPFASRLYLLSEVFYPIIADLAAHSSSIEIRRNAVSALARYDSKPAQERLLKIAERTQDQVVMVRALAGLGRFHQHSGRLDWSMLIKRLELTDDGVLRVAMIGALGRGAATNSFAYLLQSLALATKERSCDQLQALLLALFSMVGGERNQALEESIQKLTSKLRAGRKRFKPLQKPGGTLPDLPDNEGTRGRTLEQLAQLLLGRLQADPKKNASLVYSLVGGRKQLKAFQDAGFRSLLDLITPAAQLRFLEAVAAQRDAASLAFLQSWAGLLKKDEPLALRDQELASSFGAIALSLLPPAERSEIARELFKREEPATQLIALDILLSLSDASVEKACRTLLTQMETSELDQESGITKALFRKAILELSRREKLTPVDALAMQRHLKGTDKDGLNSDLPQGFRAQVRSLVQSAADGTQKSQLQRQLEALLDSVPEAVMLQLLSLHDRRDVSGRVMQLLSGAKAHAVDAQYLLAIEDEISAFVFMRAVRIQQEVIQGISFEPPVQVRGAILLAMGSMQHPMITELINNAIHSEQEDVRARACIAMGMTRDPRAAKRLLPALGSRDPFTRLCAAQGLNALHEGLPFVDWIYASNQVRVAAIQELERILQASKER